MSGQTFYEDIISLVSKAYNTAETEALKQISESNISDIIQDLAANGADNTEFAVTVKSIQYADPSGSRYIEFHDKFAREIGRLLNVGNDDKFIVTKVVLPRTEILAFKISW